MDKHFKYDTRWGFSSETELFKHIWDTTPHYSYVSGIPIREPSPANFAHVLSKAVNRYPHFRLFPDNIILVTQEEHNLIDQGTVESRLKYCRRIKSASFAAVDRKVLHLKKLYEMMFGHLTSPE